MLFQSQNYPHKPRHARGLHRGISLIEILISMFVLLFGLMGVAAIFPVGNHYVKQGENFDLGGSIAQNAFEELKARGMLRPEAWLYPSEFKTFASAALPFIQPGTGGLFEYHSNDNDPDGPGNALVIDPLAGSAQVTTSNPNFANLKTFFPLSAALQGNVWNSSIDSTYAGQQLLVKDAGLNSPYRPSTWPVRRITLPIPDPTGAPGTFQMMTGPVAETIFRLRDDLAVEQPEQSDAPSIQRWDVGGGALLRRQYQGDFSWLATIVPTTGEALAALQPAHEAYGEIRYDVSVVVFRKRDEVPSAESERLIEAELLQGGEVIFYSTSTTVDPREAVDNALDDVRTGNWISLMGVNQTTGDFVMKWYRLLTLDSKEETGRINVPSLGTGLNAVGRRGMLIGPDWPAPVTDTSVANLRAAILPGAISVVTKQLKMEDTSLWSLE